MRIIISTFINYFDTNIITFKKHYYVGKYKFI